MNLFSFMRVLSSLLILKRFVTSSKIMSQKITCSNPSTFFDSLNSAVSLSESQNVPLFVLFTGEKNPSTGKSWCPDCVAAEPLIYQTLEQKSNYILLECPVIREEYKKPDFIYRKLSPVDLKCIPTFIKWDKNGPGKRLNDAQSQVLDLVKGLVSE